VPLAHKDMYYEARQVVTCGFENPAADFVAATILDRPAAAEGCGTIRLGSLQMANSPSADPPHIPLRIRCIIPGLSIASLRPSSGSGSRSRQG